MGDKHILGQALSDDDLSEVSGGTYDMANCTGDWEKNIYGGKGFPNCAATVEDGSWCMSDDACFRSAIAYYNMKDCTKAWK